NLKAIEAKIEEILAMAPQTQENVAALRTQGETDISEVLKPIVTKVDDLVAFVMENFGGDEALCRSMPVSCVGFSAEQEEISNTITSFLIHFKTFNAEELTGARDSLVAISAVKSCLTAEVPFDAKLSSNFHRFVETYKVAILA